MAQGVYPIQESPLHLNRTLSEMVADRLTKANAVAQEQKNPYVGQRELEALLMDKLKNKYYGREKESEIGLRGAQAHHLNTESQYIPLDSMVKANTSLRGNSRFGKSYEFMKALNAMDIGSRSAWIAQHQVEWNQMLSDVSSGNSANGGNLDNNNQYAENMIMQEMQKLNAGRQPLSAQGIPASNMQQAGQLGQGSPLGSSIATHLSNEMNNPNQPKPSLATSMMNTLPIEDQPKSDDPDIAAAQELTQKARFSSNASQTQQIQDMSLLNATRKSNTAANNNRADGAKVLDLFLKESRTPENIDKFKNVAEHYSGQSGQWKASLESQLPESMQSDAYKDYIWYTTQFQKAVTSTVKQMEKLNGDQRQITSLNQLTDVLHDPKLGGKGALKTFNDAIGTLQDMSTAIFKASEIPQAKGIYKRMYGLPDKYKEYVPSSERESSDSDMIKVKVNGKEEKIHRSQLEDLKRDAAKANITVEVGAEE